MFDLDREVTKWTAAVHAERCASAAVAGVTELTDHLYCEIDRGRAEGLSDEAAFRAAIARLGGSPALTAEIAKNRSAFAGVCRIVAKLEGPFPASAEHRRILVAHGLIWATLMIATSLILVTTDAAKSSLVLLIVMYTPLWQASDLLLRRALRRREGTTR
jgi:hypothetical protein